MCGLGGGGGGLGLVAGCHNEAGFGGTDVGIGRRGSDGSLG